MITLAKLVIGHHEEFITQYLQILLIIFTGTFQGSLWFHHQQKLLDCSKPINFLLSIIIV